MSSRITAFVNVLSDTDKHFKYANEKSPAMLLVKTYQRATDVCDNFTAKIKTAALKRELNRSTSKIATVIAFVISPLTLKTFLILLGKEL